MTIKLLTVLSVLTILLSCKKTQDISLTENENTNDVITEKDLSNLNFVEFTLDPKTQNAIKDWVEYFQLQDIAFNIKKGELNFFMDNEEDIKTLFESLLESIPNDINSPSTLARIVALETKFYKLKSLVNLTTKDKQKFIDTIKEFLEAFSNLNFQMNKKIEKDSRIIEKP